MTIRTVLAEDQGMVLGAFASLLALEPDIEVVATAADGDEALAAVMDAQPDVLLTDIEMPGRSGLDVAAELARRGAPTRVVIVTTFARSGYLRRALDAGVAGYVLKDAPAERLINAVHRTLDGESPLNQELATRLLRQLAEEKQHNLYRAPSKRQEPLDDALTPRETEVLGLLTTGQTNQQIARTLTISKGTAKVHVERIIRKLGVSDRTQAAVRAIELGFTTLESRRQPYS
jgi:two-component system response regulator DesR